MMLSVIMITYGHEKFITQAIEGVLMQEVNFDIELIIADDCSPDNTQKVVEELLKNHPKAHAVKYTKHLQNKGMQPNFIWAYQQCNGEYIAICEGDDYWIDNKKLQKQVDFLEANNDYSMICHNASIIYEGVDKEPRVFSKRTNNTEISMQEILNKWIIPTASMVFRSECIKKLPIWFGDIYSGDFTLALLIRNQGKVFFLNENMSVYRVSHTGTSATATFGKDYHYMAKQHLLLLKLFNIETKYAHDKLIKLKIESINMELGFNKLKQKSILCAFFAYPMLFLKKLFRRIYQNLFLV